MEELVIIMDLKFFKNKTVLVTGHTGFKGSWISGILISCGANVIGYSLEAPTVPSLFNITKLNDKMISIIGDIRNFKKLNGVFQKYSPEIVIHMAAQPIVRDSYKDPLYTYETNVMGTVNILECVRLSETVKSFLNVTTDKVYYNNEWEWGYRESDPLDGYDPYSNSKSCSELVTHSYKDSFLSVKNISISTARAGNVIGGGDFATDRIIPDCVRAVQSKEIIPIRNPYSIRPYQHVLEPVFVYLMIVKQQYEDITFSGYYNVGPDDVDCVETGTLAQIFCDEWGEGASWDNQWKSGPHEANFLKLDCSKLKKTFSWLPTWSIHDAVNKTVEWTKAYLEPDVDMWCVMQQQIDTFKKDYDKKVDHK